MILKPACALAAAAFLASCASVFGVHGVTGNDTGGIIPWSPENQHAMRDIAGDHCARYNKRFRITSVHRQYGDYIGFVCFFARGYDPVRGAGAISTLD